MRIADNDTLLFFEQGFEIADNNKGSIIIDFEDGRYLTLIATEDK